MTEGIRIVSWPPEDETMRTTWKRTVTGAALGMALLAPGVAMAKTVCIHSAAGSGWTFVLQNVSLRPGASGAASGYAIRDDGLVTPMSGGYVMFRDTLLAGITRYFVARNVVTGEGGSTSQSTFHQIAVSPQYGNGTDASWAGQPSAGLTAASGAATIVDCRTVPTLPRTAD